MTKNTDRVIELKNDPQDVIGKDPVVAAVAVAGANHDDALSGKKVNVTFHEQDGDLGKLPVQVGLNGFAYYIPRNTPVEIPIEVLQVVQDAQETVYESKQGLVQERKKPRFSFTQHSAAA